MSWQHYGVRELTKYCSIIPGDQDQRSLILERKVRAKSKGFFVGLLSVNVALPRASTW